MIEREPPPGAIAPLPLGATLAGTGRTLFRNSGALTKIAALPFLLGMAFDFATPFIALPWQDLLRLIWFNLLWVLFTVSWLRFVLLKENSSARFFPRPARRHLYFAGYALLLGVLDLLLMLGWYHFAADPATEPIPDVTYWLAYAFIGFVKVRFAFIFPALAVDERYSLGYAWRHSHSASLPLFAIFVVAVVLPGAMLTYGINALSAAFADNVLLLYALWLLWHSGTWVIEAIYATFVAIAFRRCTGWVAAPDQSVLERFE